MSNSQDRSAVLARIRDIIRVELRQPDLAIEESTTAADVTGWDSLTHVQIIIATEKAFGIRLKSFEVAQLEDVGSLVNIALARGRIDG